MCKEFGSPKRAVRGVSIDRLDRHPERVPESPLASRKIIPLSQAWFNYRAHTELSLSDCVEGLVPSQFELPL